MPSLPTAAPTFSFSPLRGGSTSGCATSPFTLPLLSPTASTSPSGPPPSMRQVTDSFSPFSIAPSTAVAVSVRPSAAVAVCDR